MIPAAFPRSVAIALLRFAIWIAPHDTLDWGHAMLSELNHVEGNWSAFLWSLGGAGVLAKHAALAVILPGRPRRTVSSANELFAKEIPMRKTTLAVIASCVVASLLLFLAPVFRQAFHVSLAQWHDVFHAKQSFGYPSRDPELDALVKKAEQNRDAEALAFVAVRYPNAIQRERLANEAVQLDPNLTWLYAVAGTAYLSPSEIDRRVSVLKQWDPENALPHLFAAQKIGATVTYSKEFPLGKLEESPAWEKEMDAAFHLRSSITISTAKSSWITGFSPAIALTTRSRLSPVRIGMAFPTMGFGNAPFTRSRFSNPVNHSSLGVIAKPPLKNIGRWPVSVR